jgi:DNA-directed RNA polymerase subunit RPC12/RpoP
MSNAFNRFKRSAKQSQQKEESRRGSSGTFPPWEMEVFTYNVDETGRIRFLDPGDRGPYEKYFHFPQGGFPHACTLEHPLFDGKCVFCHFDQEAKEQAKAQGAKSTSSLYRRFERVMELVDFRFMHIIPHPKKQGKETLIQCQHDGPDLPSRVRCNWCRHDNERYKERHFGGHKVFEMNKTQWGQILGLHNKLGRTCIHMDVDGDGNPDPETFCGQEVYPVEYKCSSCGHTVLDDDKLATMSDAALFKYTDFEYECEKCGEKDFLEEVSVCESSKHDPKQASLFDKMIEFTITGEASSFTNNRGEEQKYTKKDFSFDTGQPFTYLDDDLETLGFPPEEAAEMIKLWDLDWRFRPERKDPKEYTSDDAYVDAVLDAQAESLKKPNPYGSSGSVSAPFGNRGTGNRSFGRR